MRSRKELVMSIPPDLHNRLYTTLLRCEAFESNDALEALFVDARISQWYECPLQTQ
jgi:hypothetical protein